MLLSRLDARLKIVSKTNIIVKKGGKARLSFFLIFILLTFSTLLSFNPEYDLSGERIWGTLFIFTLILISLGVFLIHSDINIYLDRGVVTKGLSLLGKKYIKSIDVPISSRKLLINKVEINVEAGTPLYLKKISKTSKGQYKLFLITDETSILLAETGKLAELDPIIDILKTHYGFELERN